jgi:hypothetical protein
MFMQKDDFMTDSDEGSIEYEDTPMPMATPMTGDDEFNIAPMSYTQQRPQTPPEHNF